MSRRYSDFSKKELKTINSEIEGGKCIVGYDEWSEKIPPKTGLTQFGRCSTCTNLRAAISEFGSIFAKCEEFERKLRADDPVRECTEYKKRGEMELWEMKEMAIIIEVRKKVGFE